MTTPATLGTAHIRTTPGSGGAPAPAGLSLPAVEQLLWVDSSGVAGGETGTRQDPFHDVRSAVVAANALAPATANRILIMILPGVYVETGVLAPSAYVYLAGTNREACIIRRAGTILDLDEAPFEAWNLTIQATGGTDPVIDVDSGNGSIEFHECAIISTADDNAIAVDGVQAEAPDVWFVDCTLTSGGAAVEVLSSAAEIHFVHSEVIGEIIIDDGNLYCEGLDLLGLISSTSEEIFVLHGSRIVNATTYCVYFGVTDGTAGSRSFEDNYLSSPEGENEVDGLAWDGGGESPILPVEITTRRTVMQQGFSSFISPTTLMRYVGSAGDKDFHGTLPDALDSILEDGTVVTLLEDVALGSTETLPTEEITIDGNGYTVTRTGGGFVFRITTGKKTLKNMTIEGWVELDAGGAVFAAELVKCVIEGTVDVDSGGNGSKLKINQCQVMGVEAEGEYALKISDADPTIIVIHSRLTGSSGEGAQGAVLYDTVTNDKLSVRHSTLMQGASATNPFERTGAQTPSFDGHHNGYSADPTGGGWLTNRVAVGQRFDTIDLSGDF